MFSVYLLKSKKDGNLYIGCTNNLKRRLLEHASGQSFSTKSRIPFELVYCESYRVEEEAKQRESNLKLRANAFNQLKRRISKSLRTD